MKTIADLGDLSGRRVLVRCDLNVPMDHGTITDDGRIRASLPNIQDLLGRGASVIICAHLGRPKGTPDPAYSLAPVAARLGELLGKPVAFASDTVGPVAQQMAQAIKPGEVLLVENVRFNAGETSKNDDERTTFARLLATLADVFVSDGFGAVHRKHASVYDVATMMPCAPGPLVSAEVEVLKKLTAEPQRPYAVVLGGSKVSDKLAVIDALMNVADIIMVGGGMLFTFLAAQGHEVGKSLLEKDQIDACAGYLKTAAERGVTLILPTDIVVANAFSADADHHVVPADQIPADQFGLDIGPQTAAMFAQAIKKSKTVFWNGPVGAFEMEPFSHGTKTVAQALTESDGFTVIGGGDSAAAVRQLGFNDNQFGHISTGGGASLEYLEGKVLPGLAVLEGKKV